MTENGKLEIGIVGGTGYTGVELLRILAQHPRAFVKVITSRSEAGLYVWELFANLREAYPDLQYSEPDVERLKGCDVVFFATPHGVAMKLAPELVESGVKVIDLAADFRINDLRVWENFYGMPHAAPELMEEVVYGLPELNRERIRTARIIANPGCYPTAVQLGFWPLLKHRLVDVDHLVADAKSGISGAGRGAKVGSLAAETAESFKAYGIHGHRHLPEIEQQLNHMAQTHVNLTFVPHLLPMIRGIEATLYGKLTRSISEEELQQIFDETYAEEPFVDVMPRGSLPDTRMVKGSNMCRMAVYRQQGRDTVVVTSVIDNLVKGASGQAVQNMNLMFDLDETMGLEAPALLP